MARTVTRWDPFAELAELRTRFDRMLGEFAEGEREWMPAIDVLRDDGDLIVRADVPGIQPDEIDIEVDRGMLTLSGRHEEKTERAEKDFVRRERRYGAFSRTITLPEGIDPERITATTHDGVLEVKVPMPKETEQKPVRITPKAGA